MRLSELSTHSLQNVFKKLFESIVRGFPGGSMVKNPPANAGSSGLHPDGGRSCMPLNDYACVPTKLDKKLSSLC